MTNRICRCFSLCPLWLVFLGAAASMPALPQDDAVPVLKRYATDLSGTLSKDELAQLESRLEEFDRSTSTQIVVLMVPSMGEGSLEEVALRVAEKNGIGRKGKSNGVLLFIAKSERKIRIETGYGLEGPLPDALAGTIIRREIVPHFRQGDYFGGISAGAEAIMAATKNEYTADERKDQRQGKNVLPVIVVAILIIVLVSRMRGGGGGGSGFRRGVSPWMFGGLGSGLGGRGFGGGFRGGGSFGGGFSGGGGSFGGGGASGSW